MQTCNMRIQLISAANNVNEEAKCQARERRVFITILQNVQETLLTCKPLDFVCTYVESWLLIRGPVSCTRNSQSSIKNSAMHEKKELSNATPYLHHKGGYDVIWSHHHKGEYDVIWSHL